MRVPKACFKFMTPDAWKGVAPYAGHPKWDINFILVGNTPGFSMLTDMDEHALCADVATFLCTTADKKHHARLRTHPHQALNYKSPKPSSNHHLWAETGITQLPSVRCFEEAPPEAPHTMLAQIAQPQHVGEMHADVHCLYSNQSPLLVDPDQLIFTDGSVTTAQPVAPDTDRDAAEPMQTSSSGPDQLPAARQLVGAGLFIPNKTPGQLGIADGAADTTPQDDQHARGTLLYINPSGEGPTNTITRAESAAIHEALQYGTNIATDSAACMYQLRNMMMNPMRMRHHKNKHMLMSILQKVQSSGQTVRIFKVKAHTGVLGNEYADEAAKKATDLLADDKSDQQPVACTVDAAPPYTGVFWPVIASASNTLKDNDDAHGDRGPIWLDDINGALKRHLHPIHKLGHSNADSIYYKLWQETVPTADGDTSNAYMRSSKLAPMAIRLTFQARCGQTNTANMRYKRGQAPNNLCLLCGTPDGVFHSLGGCRHMKGMYILRHNEAVWIILRWILKGRLGASVVMHDAGHRHDTTALQELWAAALEDSGDADNIHTPDPADTADDTTCRGPTAQLLGTRIPEWIYDTPLGAVQDKTNWDKFRPDILIATEGKPCHGDRIRQFHDRSIHIVEVKYCRDTDRSSQALRAEQQHEALRESLLQVGYQPDQLHMHVITLGATGTIYTDAHETLMHLGIDSKAACKRCCADLHAHAVTYVMRLLKTKWAQEHGAQKRGVG
jgi:ribonuclease HI